jgi:inner membrane protein involved in colicin E2 resistance
MHPIVRLVGIMCVFMLATVGWLILGAVTGSRTSEQKGALEGRVADLWGSPQTQTAPNFELHWTEQETKTELVSDGAGRTSTKTTVETVARMKAVDPSRSRIFVDLHLDQRRKGLLWFPLYDVAFRGAWTYQHSEDVARDLQLAFALPDKSGIYDEFRFVVDGVDFTPKVRAADGVVATTLPVKPGQSLVFEVSYRSRGMQEWTYRPTNQVGQVEDFQLKMNTDFRSIDFPKLTMSPSERIEKGSGCELEWKFARLVSGYGIGMVMPSRVQPGNLAAQMSFAAPISLGLFLVVIYVIALVRGIALHPMNLLFVAAAFFSFNLLFGYTADRLPIEKAFLLASAVSLGLVASYMRLVVGLRFAIAYAGLAQLVYQVGFSLAYFYEGYTGLSVTIVVILTLFLLMQLTGRLSWSTAFSRG